MGTTLWSASGLLVENYNCQLLCPAHVSFKNTCTNDPVPRTLGSAYRRGPLWHHRVARSEHRGRVRIADSHVLGWLDRSLLHRRAGH